MFIYYKLNAESLRIINLNNLNFIIYQVNRNLKYFFTFFTLSQYHSYDTKGLEHAAVRSKTSKSEGVSVP